MTQPAPIAVLGLLLCAAPASGELTLPTVFSDHMVLQRDRPLPVWGEADPGTFVAVRFGRQVAGDRADGAGRWSVTLAPMPASAASRTLVVETTGGERRSVEDVLVGEVWICGGQSNMEWTVDGSIGADEERANANRPTLRLIKAPHRTAAEPATTIDAAWQVSTPETVGGFTAVGYTFGRHLQDELDVPIGLLSINWGGTRIEPWISGPSLAAAEVTRDRWHELQARIATARARRPEDVARERAALRLVHEQVLAAYIDRQMKGPGASEGWMRPEHDDRAWSRVELPRLWRDTDEGLGGFDGTVWYRRSIDVPPSWANRPALLSLGKLDDSDVTFWNGVPLGRTIEGWNVPREYEVPASLVTPGRTVITIMNVDSGGAGGSTGPAEAMRVIPADPGEDPIALAGSWRWRRGGPHQGGRPPASPANGPPPGTARTDYAALYNGMLAPFVPYGVRGAIWYQGESNASEPERYRALLPLLIADWQAAFECEPFPFGVVQLAAFRAPAPDQPAQGEWAFLRDAQLHAAETVPDTGLVVTTDIGAADDIHPRNKREVGRRLALWALATTYGHDEVVHAGPRYRSMSPRRLPDGTNALALEFDHVGGGLATRDGNAPGGFAVAGTDGVFVWAKARIDDHRTVVVHAPGVERPVAVRYAWQNNPVDANLVDSVGLPASPFRTD